MRLTWTGFNAFSWYTGVVDFHGTDADEGIVGRLRSVDLGGGDDAATGVVGEGVLGSDPGAVTGGPASTRSRWRSGAPGSGMVSTGSGDDTVTQISADSIDVCWKSENVIRIWTGPGGDHLSTGIYNEVADLGPGDDVARTDRGNDRIRAGAGADRVDSGMGVDRVYGDAGADRLQGSDAIDRLIGGTGRDRVDGGQGRDRCVAEVRHRCES